MQPFFFNLGHENQDFDTKTSPELGFSKPSFRILFRMSSPDMVSGDFVLQRFSSTNALIKMSRQHVKQTKH